MKPSISPFFVLKKVVFNNNMGDIETWIDFKTIFWFLRFNNNMGYIETTLGGN